MGVTGGNHLVEAAVHYTFRKPFEVAKVIDRLAVMRVTRIELSNKIVYLEREKRSTAREFQNLKIKIRELSDKLFDEQTTLNLLEKRISDVETSLVTIKERLTYVSKTMANNGESNVDDQGCSEDSEAAADNRENLKRLRNK